MSLTSDEIAREQARIVDAYARREDHVDAGRYGWFDVANVITLQQAERHMLAAMRRHGCALATCKVLEVGCGTGFWLRQFVQWGARPENLSGIDILPARIQKAQTLCPPGVTLRCGSAAELAFPDADFDVILQSTMFSSILDPRIRAAVAAEMLRVVRPGGLVLSYDFHVSNPRNRDVCGIGKRELRRLFPRCRIEFERITLLPPIARLLAPRSSALVHALAAIKVFCTHYLAVIKKI
jgi:ubiquinone/menaquinone biosynthesis C-methylase UbiE